HYSHRKPKTTAPVLYSTRFTVIGSRLMNTYLSAARQESKRFEALLVVKDVYRKPFSNVSIVVWFY
ncbi:hypothetical protein LR003_00515, partial [candidate division NPL-UPA2 bacterium]|nr:hypothetical protein [candidate division NPL-UPA2 bacterium]